MKINTVFVDGDFKVEGAECQFFCSPSCHPAQLGPDWKYGCTNPQYPNFDPDDFVPIVSCGGQLAKCGISSTPNKGLNPTPKGGAKN